MSISTPQVESRIEFSPLPQDVEQVQDHIIEDKDSHIFMIEIEPQEGQCFDWEAIMIVLRLAMVSLLLVGFALHQSQLEKPDTNPIPPRFFIDSLLIPEFKISNGELSSTFGIKLTIANDMNSSSINIIRLDVAMTYQENKTLALVTPIELHYPMQSDVFLIDAEEMKRMNVKLSTTGWERDQPVVDDVVIQAMDKDMKRGLMRLGLQMMVVGEVQFGNGWVTSFVMYPSCNGFAVRFKAAADQQGEAATVVEQKPRECIGTIQWEHLRKML
ncbi:hypothetical protein Lal_00018085 [Lupinus albus]|uniref:Uncharacterized protein n=1 Tax=Lupinus albus TaxID=3870 RepID=A0A6A4N971_LUPAL|nr:hypothetical protein Lalb_Chr25g0288021 [Lupinus albus]KAF1866700.1 hypothetical protein Lal_00018085 [Lupinus albus]